MLSVSLSVPVRQSAIFDHDQGEEHQGFDRMDRIRQTVTGRELAMPPNEPPDRSDPEWLRFHWDAVQKRVETAREKGAWYPPFRR